MKFHTVYLSFEAGPDGRNYIGKHTTSDPYDAYLGSSLDPTFLPVGKIILGVFRTAESATAAEIQWQKVMNVVQDPTFANRAFQTATGFDTTGRQRPYHEVAGGGRAMKEMLVWNNGERITRAKECPGPEWKRGWGPFYGGGNPQANTGTRWWVNESGENRRSAECPGPKWKRGRTWRT